MTMAIKMVSVDGQARYKGTLLGSEFPFVPAVTRAEAEADVRFEFAAALQRQRRRTALLAHMLQEPPDPNGDGADVHDALMEFMLEMENAAYDLCANAASLFEDIVDDREGHYGVRALHGDQRIDPADWAEAKELLQSKKREAQAAAARADDVARPPAERRHQEKVTKIFERAFREVDRARAPRAPKAAACDRVPVSG
jgi:hypothetical protein